VIDLNDVSSITFSWTPLAGAEGYTLRLSTSQEMTNPRSIYLDDFPFYRQTADEMYDHLHLLGIGYALTDLYWTVDDINGEPVTEPAKIQIRKRPKGTFTTLVGNGSANMVTDKKLSEKEAVVHARSLVVDGNKNVLAFQRDNSVYRAVYISEAKDTVALRGAENLTVNNAVVDPATNIIYAGVDHSAGKYWVYDPVDDWMPKFVEYTGEIPTTPTDKHATGIAYHNGYLYLKYTGNANLYRVNLSTNVSEIVNTKMWNLQGMAINPVDGKLYFTSINTVESHKDGVYAVDLSSGGDPQPVALVDNGTGEPNTFNTPERICFAADGTGYVVCRYGKHAVFMIAPDGGFIKLTGNGSGHVDGELSAVKMNGPMGIAVAADGTLYIAENGSPFYIRKYSPYVPSED
jgi:hypothetical protein